MYRFLSLIGCLLVLAGCAKPMTVKKINHLKGTCNTVASNIAKLKKEKKENNHRGLAGIRSVMPVAAVANIVRGQYKTNAQIATGAWGEAIDKKLASLEKIQKTCPKKPAQ
jgi:hypothetical protein